jgi:DNA-binding MarR family transcriptional regulator
MEQQGLIIRSPSSKDQRKMMIGLSEKGKAMQKEAAQIPYNLLKRLRIDQDEEKIEELKRLKYQIKELMELLKTEGQVQP